MLLKFRSMHCWPTDSLATWSEDPRVFPFGRFLREYHLDELPQLWNVLKGQMSLVGPRPSIPEHVAQYTERQRKRLSVLPGITGLAQVSGNNALAWPKRIEVDLVHRTGKCSHGLDHSLAHHRHRTSTHWSVWTRWTRTGEGRQIEESGKLRLLLVGSARRRNSRSRECFAQGTLLPPSSRPTSRLRAPGPAWRPRSMPMTGLGCASTQVHVVSDLNAEYEAISVVSPDYVFVIGWPYLVRDDVLSIAPCVGLHPTKLPYRRGGAPLNWAILDGEPTSAVSLIRLRKGVDDGEILAQRTFPNTD